MTSKKPTATVLAEIGERLELARTVIGQTQVEFCGKARIATNTYNQYEKGKKRPDIDNALKLCDAHDLTLDWIYRGDPGGLRYHIAEAIKALRQARSSEVASEHKANGRTKRNPSRAH